VFRRLCLNNVIKTDIYSERAETSFLSYCLNLDSLDLRIFLIGGKKVLIPPNGFKICLRNLRNPQTDSKYACATCATSKWIQNMLAQLAQPPNGFKTRLRNLRNLQTDSKHACATCATSKRIQNTLAQLAQPIFTINIKEKLR